jgi:SAM-dependent methyltransferase
MELRLSFSIIIMDDMHTNQYKELPKSNEHKKRISVSGERRFAGLIGKELKYTRLAYPDFDTFQGKVGEIVDAYAPLNAAQRISVIDIGCGYGFTADIILNSRPDIELYAIDNEPLVISQAYEFLEHWRAERTFSIIEADALSFVRKAVDNSFDIVASVLTLHNFNSKYRNQFLKELPRILKPGGLFINADKYALKGHARHDALINEIGRYFDAFIPLGKYDLLREWVLHHVLDNTPGRLMPEDSSVKQLKALGFGETRTVYRNNMIAILLAKKPPSAISE